MTRESLTQEILSIIKKSSPEELIVISNIVCSTSFDPIEWGYRIQENDGEYDIIRNRINQSIRFSSVEQLQEMVQTLQSLHS